MTLRRPSSPDRGSRGLYIAGTAEGGYFATQDEEARFLRRVLWNGNEPLHARAARALTDEDLAQAINAVVDTLEALGDPDADGPVIRRWRPHRGALAIAGLWLISESRARCGPRCVDEKQIIVTLQAGGGPSSWPTPEWLTEEDFLGLLLG